MGTGRPYRNSLLIMHLTIMLLLLKVLALFFKYRHYLCFWQVYNYIVMVIWEIFNKEKQ